MEQTHQLHQNWEAGQLGAVTTLISKSDRDHEFGPFASVVSEGTALPQDLTLIREIRQTANSFLFLKLLQKPSTSAGWPGLSH